PPQHPARPLPPPVFRAGCGWADRGRRGRLDAAFLFDADSSHPGFPVRVHRAHVPGTTIGVTGWLQTDPMRYGIPTRAQAEKTILTEAYLVNRTYVALQAAAPQILD